MPLLFIAFAFALMIAFAPPLPVSLRVPMQAVAVAAPVSEAYYTKGGVVEINRITGATRFTPYRFARDLDRRRHQRTPWATA